MTCLKMQVNGGTHVDNDTETCCKKICAEGVNDPTKIGFLRLCLTESLTISAQWVLQNINSIWFALSSSIVNTNEETLL